MTLMRNMTITRRTVFWLLAISTVWFVVLAFVVLQVRERVRHDGLIEIRNVLQHKTESIERYVGAQKTSLDNLGYIIDFESRHHAVFSRSFWKDPPAEWNTIVSDFARENGFYDVFIISIQGDILYSVKEENDLHTNLFSGPYRNSELAAVFKNALSNVLPYISDFRYYPPSRDYAAFMAKPILKEGKVIGVAAVQIDNRAIHAVINDYRELGKTGEVIASVYRNGEWIAMAPLRHGGYKAYGRMHEPSCFPADEVRKGEKGERYALNAKGSGVAVAWDYIEELRWIVAVTINEQELLNGWYKLMTSLMVIFFNGVFLIGFMVVMAFRSFSGPIQELTNKAKQLSEGDYDIDINASKYDYEWQILVDAFKQMSLEIKHKIAQLNELNQSLEERIRAKAQTLQQYIDIVDKYVITSRTDKYGIITYVSEAFCRVSGYTKEELIGKNHRIVRHPDMSPELFAQLWTTISAGRVWKGEIKNRRADGTHYWVDTTITPTVENGEVVGYTAVRHDITDKKMIEEMAVTDPMTGLYNRRHYVKTIQKELNRAKRNRYSLALMMIDVDNFKLYNDTYGHQEGDEVLNRVAEILKMYTSRGGECAFRLGGEEFAVLVGSMEEAEYYDLAERIRRDVETLHIVHEKNPPASCVTISVGVAVRGPDSAITCEELYKHADAQLYRSKEQGRNRVSVGSV